MKNFRKIPVLILAAALLLHVRISAQNAAPADSTGMPGDHFSLEGAIELFKKSQSMEEFEKLLNTEENNVNNLDLNDDGKIDYVRVIDRTQGDIHTIVLQDLVGSSEIQDVAVIELEKTGADAATLQIVGDEALYGQQAIVEPYEDESAVKPGNGRNGPAFYAPNRIGIIVNVWGWPCVRFVYRPAYVVYASPWSWGVYPTWWRPWRPYPWSWFHPRVIRYRPYCRPVTVYRVERAHRFYAPQRVYCHRDFRPAPAPRGRYRTGGRYEEVRRSEPRRSEMRHEERREERRDMRRDMRREDRRSERGGGRRGRY